MTLTELLREGTEKLKSANNEAPVLEAGVMLCHVLECDKTFLYTRGDFIPDADKVDAYREMLDRRLNGEPLQYITGHQEFMSLDFKVTSDVLIPRQDTEILVETVIEYVKGLQKSDAEILDIGTGSGCIAVSLAHFLGGCRITAVDISDGALAVSRVNAKNNNAADRIRFIKSDIFKGLECHSRFDVIVSNPPYITPAEIMKLHREVRDYEPLSALDGGEDGLYFYRTISKEAVYHLKPSGMLAFEVGYDQATDVADIMKKDYKEIQIKKDLSGINRVVSGLLKAGY